MKKKNSSGVVYSTDPTYKYDNEEIEQETIPTNQQRLRVCLDTKQRAGKAVTLITGFQGKKEDLELLGKQLKGYCGTGGSVKDGEILVQGDNRDKVMQWLEKNGYKGTKRV